MSRSLRPEASSTNTRAARTVPSWAREESLAPRYTPGMLPRRTEDVRLNWKSPNRMWPSAAEATSGIACTRSVPTSWRVDSIGYRRSRATMITEPEPTEVMPTIKPPTIPMATVGTGFSRKGSASGIWPATIIASRCRAWRSWMMLFTTIDVAATIKATPRASFNRSCTTAPVPNLFRMSTPTNADGIEPTQSQRTSVQLTVPRRTWTPPPIGFMTIAATRSLDTAARGWTLNRMTRMGVIRAPPPIPVRPTVKPTISPANAT